MRFAFLFAVSVLIIVGADAKFQKFDDKAVRKLMKRLSKISAEQHQNELETSNLDNQRRVGDGWFPWKPIIKVDPEVNMNVKQLIESKGYLFEEHNVTTDDGYILTVHRIPGIKGQPRPADGSRPVALIQHGLLCDSSFWLMNLPHQNLPFLLADKGVDVWLGNNRGNNYARHHKTLSPDSEAFWNFSWDEMAKYDLPNMLSYIRNATRNAANLNYIGHSEGTVQGFAGFPKMNVSLSAAVRKFYALAPVTSVGYMKSPIRVLSKYTDQLVKILGNKDFLADPHGIIKVLAKTICNFPKTSPLCENILFVICGFDQDNMNGTRLPVYISHTPSSTSVKNMVHFAQMVQSKLFVMYDYGSADANKQHYNQSTPPLYDMSSATYRQPPVVAFTGGEDWLADPRDVLNLLSQLQQHDGSPSRLADLINVDAYDHLDFGWGIDANERIYKYIVDDIINY